MKHTYELCHGRHETGCDKAVFPSEVNPMDFDGMSHIAAQSLKGLQSGDELVLYVTGLTPATAAVISFCVYNCIGLTLMHFDRESVTYKPQEVVTLESCPFCGATYVRTRGIWHCPGCGGN